jgi:Na+-driven multidrug efflux pump
MLSVSTILSGDFSGRDKRIYQTVANGIAFGANVALCFLWIPRWGIVGAAWASTVAYSLQAVIMLAFFKILSGRGILETLIIRADDVALYVSLVRKLLGRARVTS